MNKSESRIRAAVAWKVVDHLRSFFAICSKSAVDSVQSCWVVMGSLRVWVVTLRILHSHPVFDSEGGRASNLQN